MVRTKEILLDASFPVVVSIHWYEGAVPAVYIVAFDDYTILVHSGDVGNCQSPSASLYSGFGGCRVKCLLHLPISL